MKKIILSLAVFGLFLLGCSSDATLDPIEENIVVNLETFIPDLAFDQSPKGKYVGVFGHHTNPELHGKIFINAGQRNQYAALVKLVNGETMKFTGTPASRNGSIINFTGNSGRFMVNLQNFEETIASEVELDNELTQGYIVLQKSTRGALPFILTGTYVDSTDPNFTGNWDLIGTGTQIDFNNTVMLPGFPVPINVTISTQEIATLSISHSGSTAPILDNSFETNTTTDCFTAVAPGLTFPTAPSLISNDLITDLLGPISGTSGSVGAGGQSSVLNGSTATWNLTYSTPVVLAPFLDQPEAFYNEDCSVATAGSWSWNGRSGTISFAVEE